MKLRFDFGRVVSFEELPPNSVALDGYVAGPQLDAELRRFSFDHHGGGLLRLVMLATCQQVALALELGLALDDDTQIFLNDLDADTVLSAWLLTRSESRPWLDPRVSEVIAVVGFVDAHGPLRAVHPLQIALGACRTRGGREEALSRGLAIIDDWWRGAALPPIMTATTPSPGFAWRPADGWQRGTFRDFADLYRAGYLAGVLWTDEPDGSRSYGLAKKSDLVALPLGPASRLRPPQDDADYLPTLLGRLARAERRENPRQEHSSNWGGGSSVGGAPRNADGSASRLSPDEVFSILSGSG